MQESGGIMALLSLYPLALLLGGLVWLVQDARQELAAPPINSLLPWNARWLDFTFTVVGVALTALVVSSVTAEAVRGWEENPALDPWRAPLAGLSFQLSILAFILVGQQSETGFIRLPMSPRVAPRQAMLRAGFRQFVIAIPLVFVVAAGWERLLVLFKGLGIPVSLDRQEVVELFDLSQPPALILTLVVVAVVLAPITEELLFRGIIYRFLKGRSSPRTAMILSSLLFSAMHFNVMVFIPLFLLGMLLCRSYEREHNLLAPIFFHALFNANTIGLIMLTQWIAPTLETT